MAVIVAATCRAVEACALARKLLALSLEVIAQYSASQLSVKEADNAISEIISILARIKEAL